MQERELAHRTVHMLSDEMLWHCATKTCCECKMRRNEPEHEDKDEDEMSPWSSISPWSHFSEFAQDADLINKPLAFGFAWYVLEIRFGAIPCERGLILYVLTNRTQVLLQYHRLEITRTTDLLPALSGLAKSVEHLQPGQYIAGMWEKDIVVQLAWSAGFSAPRQRLSGPSFSWVAAKYELRWWPPHHYEAVIVRCAFVASTCKLATANPYGHILGCSITVRGPLMQADRIQKSAAKGEEYEIQLDDIEDKVHVNAQEHHRNESARLLRRSEDCTDSDGTKNPVMCLELYQTDDCSTALLLQRSANTSNYIRIGLLSCPSNWFRMYAVEETITII
jgi:hypothetical protein